MTYLAIEGKNFVRCLQMKNPGMDAEACAFIMDGNADGWFTCEWPKNVLSFHADSLPTVRRGFATAKDAYDSGATGVIFTPTHTPEPWTDAHNPFVAARDADHLEEIWEALTPESRAIWDTEYYELSEAFMDDAGDERREAMLDY